MISSPVPTSAHQSGGVEARHANVVETVTLGLLCILLFAVTNPFLALFLVALISLFRAVPATVVTLSAAIAFSLMFYFRDYGIYWYDLSTDDVPTYVALYEANYGLSWLGMFSRFVSAPNGNEILWNIPWWVLLNGFDGSDQMFVYLHYLLIFLALFVSLATLSTRLLAPLALVMLLLTPVSLDGIAHIWRQQLAASMLLAGVGLYTCRKINAGKWLIYASPFMHVSFIFFVLTFMASEFIRKHGGYANKLKFMLFLVPMLMVIPVLSTVAVSFLDSIGMARIMDFFMGYGEDTLRVYLLIGVYAVPQLIAFYVLRNDATNDLILTLCLAVFSLVLALPGSNSIYDRLLMVTVPLLGLYFYRCFVMNIGGLWHAPLLIAVFVSGAIRLYRPTLTGEGIATFVAYGNAFDPTLGVVRMLFNFLGV